MTESERLDLEILGLLLQVAWADEEVVAREAASILGRARSLNLDPAHIDLLEACLRGDKTLPPPDMGFLRQHKDAALSAVRALIAEGDHVNADESAVIAEIEELLG